MITGFHRLLHERIPQGRYQDWPVWKSPLDMAVYHEVVWHTKPERIVELGTGHGGFTLYLAHMLDQLGGHGEVVSVDVEDGDSFRHIPLPMHPRITYLRGRSSLDMNVVGDVTDRVAGFPTMVILDSDHHSAHVIGELRRYAPLVTFADYLVIEDTDLQRVVPAQEWIGNDGGPDAAVQAWLDTTHDFVDTRQSKYLVTSHTWLRRRSPVPLNPYALK